MRNSIYSAEQDPQEVVNWSALQTDFSPTASGNIGWILVHLSTVVFCALGLYLFAGLGAGLAGLIAAWFVLYRN